MPWPTADARARLALLQVLLCLRPGLDCDCGMQHTMHHSMLNVMQLFVLFELVYFSVRCKLISNLNRDSRKGRRKSAHALRATSSGTSPSTYPSRQATRLAVSPALVVFGIISVFGLTFFLSKIRVARCHALMQACAHVCRAADCGVSVRDGCDWSGYCARIRRRASTHLCWPVRH